jgi:hypothetical protein
VASFTTQPLDPLGKTRKGKDWVRFRGAFDAMQKRTIGIEFWPFILTDKKETIWTSSVQNTLSLKLITLELRTEIC